MYFLSFNSFVTPACDHHGRGRHAVLMHHFPQSFKLESSLSSRYKDALLGTRYIKHIVYKLYELEMPEIINAEKVGQ